MSAQSLSTLVERLWPLHRTLVADDMFEALEIIRDHLPGTGTYKINRYPSGMKAWTWTVPEKFVVNHAYLELLDGETSRRIIDFADNPLHLVSYSPPFEGELTFAELDPHLHVSQKRPDAIPWVFKYYDRDWGFCLPHTVYQALPKEGRYKVAIDTEFAAGEMGVGEYTIEGTSGDYLLIVCAICHPMQVNDSISGVAAAVDFVRKYEKSLPGRLGVKILFVPEVIGSIAYFSRNEEVIEKCRYGIFGEFLGIDYPIRLQRTRQDTHLWDRIARYVIDRATDGNFREGPFCSTVITNDEKVTNAPGVDIPTIAVNRWPDGGWEKYHTSDDDPSTIIPEKISEISRIYGEMFTILETNFCPQQTFKGPLFLSGVELGFDWQADPTVKRKLRDMIYCLDGTKSALELAEMFDLEYTLVLKGLEAMSRQNLIEKIAVT